jgi:hypothetical protein
MFKTTAIFISIIGFVIPAIAQEKEQRLPENTIDCRQFKKTGPQEWSEVGTPVFDLGAIKDINLTGQPVTPRYFKFGGIDLYTVIEQKCGAGAYFYRANAAQAKGDYESAIAEYNEGLRRDPNLAGAAIQRVFALQRLAKRPAPDMAAQAPVALEQAAAAPKKEPEQDKSASATNQPAPQEQASDQPAPQEPVNKAVPTKENEIVFLGSAPCGDRKSVYIADGLGDPEGGRGMIEIVYNNNLDDEGRTSPQSEFVIREYRGDKLEWSYTGKNARGRFMFTPVPIKQGQNFDGYMLTTQVHYTRPRPVVLTLNYVKPNRNGTGEPILYIAGLRTLFSKENPYRFKFEGKRPLEYLPEAFYFDRCE